MFAGIVEGKGIVQAIEPDGPAIHLTVEAPADWAAEGLALGDSVAINGCCLTVVRVDGLNLTFDAGEETLSKTNLGKLEPGHCVNLERSLPANGRIGGHFVQGHVDGVATVDLIDRDGDWVMMWFRLTEDLSQLLVPKGSVAVDGISLTVVNSEPDRFSVALIPHTLDMTTLGTREVGDPVNIETDILGKYVLKLLTEGKADTTLFNTGQ